MDDRRGDELVALVRDADGPAAPDDVTQIVERLQRVLDTSIEAFVSMDEAGLITGWNAAAEKVFGLARAEAVGRRLADTIVPPRFRDQHHLGIGRFLTTGERHVLDRRIEISAWHHDGYEFPVELAVWAVRDARHGWTFNAFIHDITERRRSDEALRAAYEQEREAAARLRELDVARSDFVATVSHEFRTPLTNVIGHLEVLASGDAGPLTPAQTRSVEVIGRNAERLRALIEDLLTISRVEAGVFDLEFGPAELGSVLRGAAAAVEPRATRRGQELVLDIEGRLDVLDADVPQLQRALTNLLLNAVNFSPDGARVTLAARGTADHVEITVSDAGVGIGPDEVPKLFTRFFRGTFAVREAVQGAGLGLSITKTIVEGHGGEITVESKLGVGTTFTVRIPREGRPPAG